VLASNQSGPRDLAISGTTLYWTQGGSIMKCATTCQNNAQTILSGEAGGPVAVQISGTNLYWLNGGASTQSGELRTCSLSGACTPVTLASKQNSPLHLAVDSTAAYWISTGNSAVRRCTLPGCADVSDYPLAGQNGLAIDQNNIYWSFALGGTIDRCSLAGCKQATVLASGQKFPTSVALDGANVYWITDSSVMKMPK
jgi:hypothetical protein